MLHRKGANHESPNETASKARTQEEADNEHQEACEDNQPAERWRGSHRWPLITMSQCSPRSTTTIRQGARPHQAGLRDDPYLIPMTIESGPVRCSTRVSRNPASVIQPAQSAPV